MKRTIIFHPNDAMLRKKAALLSVQTIATDTSLQTLIDDMIDTMHAAKGIGIAAPQVNESLSVCIINNDAFPAHIKINGSSTTMRSDIALINPTWEKTSKKYDVDVEGCLSIPGLHGNVKRWTQIDVTALDRSGNALSFSAKHYLARVIQHEIDHLDGILYIDRTDDTWQST